LDVTTEYEYLNYFTAMSGKANKNGKRLTCQRKAPWIATTFGSWFGWVPKNIIIMAKFIECPNYSLVSFC
jgi:hypothetical protein